LGNLYSAQFYEAMKKAEPDLESDIAEGNLETARQWLLDNIHCHGSVYSAAEICEKVTGEPLNPGYFVDYCNKKFGEIYEF
jgi:carboxypeptidase Taq